ncbi:MAG: hypothetical protein EA376_05390 [Phycisphaeraceae bacterium]|nr:MAG: hypothetical protein EA376_05390 [Phycisphaeraceae bacterium]
MTALRNKLMRRGLTLAVCCLAAATTAADALGASWIMRHGHNAQQYQDFFDNELPAGYRPISINVNNGIANPRFTVICVQDPGVPWEAQHGLTSAEYQTALEDLFDLGYRPIAADAYGTFPNERYAAAWVNDGLAPANWVARHRMTAADLQTESEAWTAAGFRMTWLSGTGSGSDTRFTALWERNFEGWNVPNPTATWNADAVWNLNAEQYQTHVENRACAGYRVVCITVYGSESDPRFGAVFLRTDGENWELQPHYVARHGQTGDDFQDMADDFVNTTMQPTAAVEYGGAGNRRYAIVYHDDPGAPVWTTTGQNVPALSMFDDAMQDFMQSRKISQGALAITVDNALVYARGFTWAPPGHAITQLTTPFRVASVSKPITATAIMRLIEQNIILPDGSTFSLATTLGQIPDAIVNTGWTDSVNVNRITIAHLLRHTAGWDIDGDNPGGLGFDPMFRDATVADDQNVSLPVEIDDIINYMKPFDLSFFPGNSYAYSNFGYAILGRIVEILTGDDYEMWVHDNVLCPVGAGGMYLGRSLIENVQPNEARYRDPMNRWCAGVHDDDRTFTRMPYGRFNVENFAAHGGWVGDVLQLTRYVSSFTDTASNPVVSQGSIDFMWNMTPQSGNNYGAGWSSSGSTRLHNGSISGTWAFIVRRNDGVAYSFMFNQRTAGTNSSLEGNDWQIFNDLQNLMNQFGPATGILWPTHNLWGAGDFCTLPCPGDFNGDGSVGSSDLAALLSAWGPCPPFGACPWDLNGDGVVGSADLGELLSWWGRCP